MSDDGISISVTGLSELKEMLEDLSTKQADRAIRKALKAGAAIEQAAIIERAPVKVAGAGGVFPEGALKSDIVVKMTRDNDGAIVATVGPDTYTKRLASWVENGHRIVTGGYSRVLPGGKTRGPGKVHDDSVPQHPFVRPAFEATQQEVADTMATVLIEEVTKAANRNGKS
jgi:HK97 gp10 family phage protein